MVGRGMSANRKTLLGGPYLLCTIAFMGVLSKLKMESGLQETAVFALVKPVEARRGMGDILLHLVCLFEQVHREHPLAKISFVERAFQHQFIQMLQFGERELLGQQLESDGLVTHL